MPTAHDMRREHDILRALAVDWELAAIGDPLADLALALVCWPEAADPPERVQFLPPATRITALPGFPTRAEVTEEYARVSGGNVSALPLYEAFALFRLAVIFQGIHYRHVSGATDDLALEVDGDRGLVRCVWRTHAWRR